MVTNLSTIKTEYVLFCRILSDMNLLIIELTDNAKVCVDNDFMFVFFDAFSV